MKSEFTDGGRLGSPDQNDPDAEIIINNLLEIQRHIALKMFQYGVHFARLE